MSEDYRFIEKDPIIDLARTEAQHLYGHNLSPKALQRIADDSGVSVQTLRSWFNGDTRFPRSLTVRFVLDALDCRVQVVRKGDGTVVRGPRS